MGQRKIDEITEYYSDEEFLQADGFDDAIIGVVSDFNSEPKLAYSQQKCIEILIERDKMSYEEAEEYFDYNVQGAYMGEKTPIWVDDMMFFDNN